MGHCLLQYRNQRKQVHNWAKEMKEMACFSLSSLKYLRPNTLHLKPRFIFKHFFLLFKKKMFLLKKKHVSTVSISYIITDSTCNTSVQACIKAREKTKSGVLALEPWLLAYQRRPRYLTSILKHAAFGTLTWPSFLASHKLRISLIQWWSTKCIYFLVILNTCIHPLNIRHQEALGVQHLTHVDKYSASLPAWAMAVQNDIIIEDDSLNQH